MQGNTGLSSRARRVLVQSLVVVVAAVGLGQLPTSTAQAAAPIDPAVLGTTADAAAGSCWEIKQVRPAAPSGAYWVLTPQMSEPRRVYCDQVTDGGGWVLVGKGREGWTREYDGRGAPADLLSPDMPMGPQAYQYDSRIVDELLNDRNVSTLSEGVRIRRAASIDGSQWQEARVRFAKMKGWAWTLGAEHPLTSWSFGTTTGTGGTWTNYGSGQVLNRMVTTTSSAKGYKIGYGYGSSVTGQNNNTSYLWAPTNGGTSPLPFAQVYLRPRILSTDAGFTAVGDGGTAAITRQLVTRSLAEVSPWGVSGTAGSTGREGNVEVQAFTQSGNTMFVGGNFRYVQQDAAGTGRVQQSFLAAFDVTTGQWISSFRPTLNEQVRALATLPDGTVVAAGDFSQANGQAKTAIVALDPTTGATRSGWNLTLENRVSGGVLTIRTLDVSGSFLYIGGAVTHFRGGSAPNTVRYMRNLGRVSVANGTPSADWNPELNGTVESTDGSADTSRTYAAGFFTTSRGVAANKAAVLQNAAGAALVPWSPVWSASASYQQAIKEVGSRLWVGGSEHSTFSYDPSTLTRLSGEITKNTGGDVQAINADNGVVYVGSHASDMSYTNAFTWPNVGSNWTDANSIKWVAAFDAATGTRIPDFVPNLGLRLGSGVWAIQPASNGTVWMGGDLQTVETAAGGRFAGGFARFPTVDATAPLRPANARVTGQTATSVTLAWNTVSDAGGGVRYQVLRDDRTIATTTGNTGSITVPKGGDGRFFVRAVDAAGNVGPSTTVIAVANGLTPPTASFDASTTGASVSVDAGGSSSPAGALTDYAWNFGDGATGSGQTASHTYTAGGTHTVTLTVTDSAGQTATTTRDATVVIPPASEVVIADGSAWRWRYATDAPPATWNARTFDASGWASGAGPLGWGSAGIATDIDGFATTADRARTAYFTKSFDVDDVSSVTRLVLDTLADDGAVVYVNGTEVARSNMPAGAVSHLTYASSARRVTVATADPVVVDVPLGLLVEGDNVVSVETHLNYRATPDLTFDLNATITRG